LGDQADYEIEQMQMGVRPVGRVNGYRNAYAHGEYRRQQRLSQQANNEKELGSMSIKSEEQRLEHVMQVRKVNIVYVAVVLFESGSRTYDFLTDDENLKPGDMVVCHVNSNGFRGLSIGEVKTFKTRSAKATNWLVQKVDLTAHQERIDRHERMQDLKAEMDARYKKDSELEKYRRMAERDPAMTEMLQEYEKLQLEMHGKPVHDMKTLEQGTSESRSE
jgi:hypothetical protein